MKKIFFSIVLLLSISAYSQSGADSIRILELKKAITSTTGNAKVDYLNDLAREFNYLGRAFKDSTRKYALQANAEAKKSGYLEGLGYSYAWLTGVEAIHFNNFAVAEGYYKEALAIGEKLNNPRLLGWAHLTGGEIARGLKISSVKLEKVLEYFIKAGDQEGEAEVSNWLCMDYSERGDYVNGFSYCQRSIELSMKKRIHNISWGHFLMNFSLMNMSELYRAAGDYETAMQHLRQAKAYAKANNYDWDMKELIGSLFVKMGQVDSALFYLPKYSNSLSPFSKMKLAEAYLLANNHQTSLKLFKEAIDTVRRKPFNKSLSRGLLGLATAYEKTKNYKDALRYANEGFLLAKSRNEWEVTLEGYNLLSRLYDKTGRYQSAYTNLRKYTSLKDSVINRQFLWRLSNYKRLAEDEKRTGQINLLNKENQLKKSELKQEGFVKKSLVAGLFFLIILGGFIFRTLLLKRKNERLRLQKDLELEKLQSEQKQTEFQRQAIELEMQALRAQMNPHFIFNCLSSINRFIFKNDNTTASDYLTRFSRLIRMVLMNSQKKLITLEDELEMLRLYLDMERMRFKNGFDYSITTNNTIDAGAIFIPPLLLQPFCENAIWHGLMHKEGQGHLNISVTEENRFLICTITDNGIGREKAATFKSKSAEKDKSLGLKITSARLALLNKEQNKETAYQIEDVLNEEGTVTGTKVNLKIFYKEFLEEIEQNA